MKSIGEYWQSRLSLSSRRYFRTVCQNPYNKFTKTAHKVISTRKGITSNKNLMNALGSIKPLDLLEHACGTPLIIEVYVHHTYPLEAWG